MTSQRNVGSFDNRVYAAQYAYDFTVDGGAIGSIQLRTDSPAIPPGAAIIGAVIDVTRDFVQGGGGTAALTLESAGDLQSAADANGYTAGRASMVSTGSADSTGLADAAILASANLQTAGVILTTVPRVPNLVIAGAAITDGACTLVLQYVVS